MAPTQPSALAPCAWACAAPAVRPALPRAHASMLEHPAPSPPLQPAEVPPPQRRARKGRLRSAAAQLVLLALTTFGCAPSLPDAACAAASSSLLRQQEETIENLFDKSTPSVVYISTFTQRYNALDLNAMVEVPQGTGSGFAWDSAGHIVTNYHVIRNAQEAKVTVTGAKGVRTVYSAKLVGANPDKDVAVLELAPKEGGAVRTVPIQLGSSSTLRVGQTVLAIGARDGSRRVLPVCACRGAHARACTRCAPCTSAASRPHARAGGGVRAAPCAAGLRAHTGCHAAWWHRQATRSASTTRSRWAW